MRKIGPCLAALGALLLFSFVGCASHSIPTDSSLKNESNEGLVILSVSHDLSGGRGARALFYLDGGVLGGRGGQMFRSIKDVAPMIPGASDFEENYGQLVVIKLTAGEHEISTWQISNGTGLRIYPREKPEPLKFEVVSGQIKYLGNLHANLAMGRNIFGTSIVGNGYPEVRDEQSRDIPLFERKYPQFKGKAVAEMLPLGPWIRSDNSRRLDPPPPSPPIKRN